MGWGLELVHTVNAVSTYFSCTDSVTIVVLNTMLVRILGNLIQGGVILEKGTLVEKMPSLD